MIANGASTRGTQEDGRANVHDQEGIDQFLMPSTELETDSVIPSACWLIWSSCVVLVLVPVSSILTLQGGVPGNGKQWWSWITLHDQIRAIVFALENPIPGPVNLTAPNPVTNQEFTAALARAMHRPALFPAPAIALKIALGGFSSEILGSKRVIPHVLQEAGFTWDYPHISEALAQLIED